METTSCCEAPSRSGSYRRKSVAEMRCTVVTSERREEKGTGKEIREKRRKGILETSRNRGEERRGGREENGEEEERRQDKTKRRGKEGRVKRRKEKRRERRTSHNNNI